MSKLNNSVDAQIYFALRVSERSGIPMLFLSAPGVGKSTAVRWWTEDNGYVMEDLRGNSYDESEILGYDKAKENPDVVKHIAPSWFDRIWKNHEAGKKTCLFLDEITTCPSRIQSTFLQIVFDRKVRDDFHLPDDCLVVAAGNYSQSLGTDFGLMSPLMNRFCIYNIVPTINDIISSLSHYSTIALGGTGREYRDEKTKIMKDMDGRAKNLTGNILLKASDRIESTIRSMTAFLNKEGKYDPSITETQNLFGDLEGDETLPGFITQRTLHFAIQLTITAYQCFGKEGLLSFAYKRCLEGLIGMALSRDKSKNIVKNRVTEQYYDVIKEVLVDIEKLDNDQIGAYEEYLDEVVFKNGNKVGLEESIQLGNKIKELKTNTSLASIERPIDPKYIIPICDIFLRCSDVIKKDDLKSSSVLEGKYMPVSEFASLVTRWNQVADLFEVFGTLIEDDTRNYPDQAKETLAAFRKKFKNGALRKLKVIEKSIKAGASGAVEVNVIPKFHDSYILRS